ncbi:MAG: hypothetical protein GXO69_01355 [Acidobacteria bacterium]|nr:hypothetical protein [Acidobacteriota bacterium]
MDLHFSVIPGQTRNASFIHLDEGIRNYTAQNTFSSPLVLSAGLRKAVKLFSRRVAILRRSGTAGRLELLILDGSVVIRAKRPGPGAAYKFFEPDVSVKKIENFLNRRSFFHSAAVSLKSGTFNLITGRNGEKFLHEWLSHPAEEGEPLPDGVSLRSVSPHFYSFGSPRLVRGRIQCRHTVDLPESWLLIRTVGEGRYEHERRRVFFSVTDAFLKKDSLIQSLYPARVSVSVDDLNRGFSGCVSEKTVTGSGFICSKFGEEVFGRIVSPAVLFTEIPLEVEA